MKSDIVRFKKVGGKNVYIVENHHEVLIPWAEYASKNKTSPVLLTFDHHMDTRSAFYRYSRRVAGSGWKIASNRLVSDMNINEPSAVKSALERLCNNEHIDFALKKGIISSAVVFSLMGAGICRDYANNRICYIDTVCTGNCNKDSCDDKSQINAYDNVIEGEELLYKLNQINRFIPGFFISNKIRKKYILDIDLDCFNTKKSINPIDMSVFYYLVDNAEIVTIAREGYYVELEKRDEDINEKYLLEKLLGYIENARYITGNSHIPNYTSYTA